MLDDQYFTQDDLAQIETICQENNSTEEFFDPAVEHLACLKTKFGLDFFREMQWEVIRMALYKKRDVCAVMATGHGKSLCYQFPAVFNNGITFVISPLIALMEAQVYLLKKTGISACLLGSAQTDPNIVQRINQNEFSVIYCCPEHLRSLRGTNLLRSLKHRLTLIAIDEAHSISQWGHDFRQDYRKLNVIREIIPNVPILAVTATATEDVRQDIVRMVGLNAPRVIVTTFDRPNLSFFVKRKSRSVWDDLRQWVQNVNGSVIIYVLKIAETNDISALLARHGIECEIYHASLSIKTRSDVLNNFLTDKTKIIVATIAFGMGIDKPDIRFVIHYGAGKSLESYYQECGRAGRDGLPAKVVIYFDEDDFALQEYFLTNREVPLPASTLNHLRRLNVKFQQYLYSNKCRRKTILDYFGDDTSSLETRPNCCDNCERGSSDNSKKPVTVSPLPLPPALRCFAVNGMVLSQILLQVRDAIATAQQISDTNFIASADALARIVRIPPQNFDEFRSLALDGFTIERIYRFGPTFINAINVYSRGQLEMQSILRFQPVVAQSRTIPPNLTCTIEAGKTQSELIHSLNYTTDDEFVSDVEYLIQTGYPITKDQIKTLCNAQNVDFDEFRNSIDDNVMKASSLVTQEMIADICTNYQGQTANRISDAFARLAIAYCKVRDHLHGLDVAYFDCAEHALKNAQKLLAEERMQPPDHLNEYVAPFRYGNNYARNIVDLFFGDCVFCEHNSYNDSSDDDRSHDSDDYDRFNLFEYDGYGSGDEAEEYGAESSSNEVEEISESDATQYTEQEDEQGESSSVENVSAIDGRSPNVSEHIDDDTGHRSSDDSPIDRDEGSVDGVIAKRRRIS